MSTTILNEDLKCGAYVNLHIVLGSNLNYVWMFTILYLSQYKYANIIIVNNYMKIYKHVHIYVNVKRFIHMAACTLVLIAVTIALM